MTAEPGNRMNNGMQKITQCMRCGTCCRKGGPGLHDEDIDLVMEKIITPESLYTIRTGELVKDNINGKLVYADTEIIKTGSFNDSGACVYFEETENACLIYEQRPVQCRALKCWDTAAILQLAAQNRIGRKDLFGHIDWICDLIETHESMCGYKKIHELVENRRAGDRLAGRQLSILVAYDQSMRELAVEKAELGKDMLNLIFGIPVAVVLSKRFGIKVKSAPGTGYFQDS